ncbi:hypothetical protein ILYODFUR_029317 [Ilyodon furcidens]|uniref:Uncharacterized protein n=1 Tax=Ilyodon furcidens TaxID=33524 RepID=A0ABV0UL39_9TELE
MANCWLHGDRSTLDLGQIQRRSEPQASKGSPEHRNPKRTITGTTTTPQRRARESQRGTTKQPQCRIPRELER